MTRTDNIIRNSKFAIIKFVMQLVLQFILRTVLIYTLGKEYVGINGLFSNILNLLNLADLGIGTAIVFSMYKPIAENDIEKVKSLSNLYKKIYNIIATIIFVVGLAIIPLLKFLVKDGYPDDINIYIVYIVLLVNTVISYFAAHKRSLLFAYQRNDIENKIRTTALVSLNLVQIILLLVTKNYYLYVFMMPVFTMLECILVITYANKLFPEINGKASSIDSETKKQITKNVAALSMHKLGGVIVFSTDSILLSLFFGLSEVGIYSNYYLIISSLISLFSVIATALKGSIGNLIATSDKEKVYQRYKFLNFAFSWVVGWSSICFICLFQDFMLFWTRSTDYLFPMFTVIILVAYFYIKEMREVNILFEDAGGILWQDRYKALGEAISNPIFSILFIKWVGISGVFIGTIISSLLFPSWIEPYVLHKHLFDKPKKNYFINYFFNTIITILIGGLTYFICSLIGTTIIGFIAKCLICCIVPNLGFLLCYFRKTEFKDLVNNSKILIGKIFKKSAK